MTRTELIKKAEQLRDQELVTYFRSSIFLSSTRARNRWARGIANMENGK